MADLPKDYSLIGDLVALRKDLRFVRALRGAKFLTTSGEIPIVYSPQAGNTTIDLRALSASGTVTGGDIPSVAGAGDSYLATNGAVAFWQTYTTETDTWCNAIIAAGGTLAAGSRVIADTLIRAIQVSGFSSKIVYMLPLLGGNLAAARVPLRDSLAVGIAGNTAFVNGDFSQATGLQGNGTSKYLNLLVKPSQLGATNNGGMGYWENNINFGGTSVEPMGCYEISGSGNRFTLDLRTTLRRYNWSNAANGAITATPATNGHFYGQRSGATSRELFFNGVSLATDTTNDAAGGASDLEIRLVGCQTTSGATQIPQFWAGRCAVGYMTDGTLTAGEVASLHTIFQTYLMGPTGRP